MYYTVKYKHPLWIRWKTLKNIKEDNIVPENKSRVFIDKYENRYEFPSTFMYSFDIARLEVIKAINEKNKQNGAAV